MSTKNIGLIILFIGLIMALYTGFNYATHNELMDMGSVHGMMNNSDSSNWSPFIGLGVMVIGGLIFLAGKKKLV